MATVHACGTDWFYTRQGQGEPVLFLHGGCDTIANYTRFLASLANGYDVIAIDRRGHGRTADTDGPYDYALLAEELREVTAALGLAGIHIIGFSDGANIGLHMASRYPDFVKSIIAISGNYKVKTGMSKSWLELISAISLDYMRENFAEVVEQYLDLSPKPDLETFVAKTTAVWNQDIAIPKERLADIRAKTLLVGGDRDIVLTGQLVEMREMIPDASLLILPYCGHYIIPDFTYPATAVSAVEIFKDFLATRFADHSDGMFI